MEHHYHRKTDTAKSNRDGHHYCKLDLVGRSRAAEGSCSKQHRKRSLVTGPHGQTLDGFGTGLGTDHVAVGLEVDLEAEDECSGQRNLAAHVGLGAIDWRVSADPAEQQCDDEGCRHEGCGHRVKNRF